MKTILQNSHEVEGKTVSEVNVLGTDLASVVFTDGTCLVLLSYDEGSPIGIYTEENCGSIDVYDKYSLGILDYAEYRSESEAEAMEEYEKVKQEELATLSELKKKYPEYV